MKDVFEGKNLEKKCLDQGFVKLIDSMPRLIEDSEESADYVIAEAARCSYKRKSKTKKDDKALIRYLMRHQHTSPFEMIEFKFHCKMPIFVAREWIRHRTACLSGDVNLWFDEPHALLKNKRKRGNFTVYDIYKKWTNGSVSEFFPPQKNENVDKIDCDKVYTVSELSKITGLKKQSIRLALVRYNIFCNKNPYKVYGKDWINYANKNRIWKVDNKKRISNMNLRMMDEVTGEIKHTHITDIWYNGEKDVFEIEFENGYKIKSTEDHLYYTDYGWKTLKEATNLRIGLNSCVTWDDHLTPSFASNGIPCYQDYKWMKERREKGMDVNMISNEAGVSYFTIRKWLKKLNLSFSSKEKSILSGLKQRGQKRTILKQKVLSKIALENIRKARSGEKSNFWKGGISSERENIGRWTTENSKKIFKKYNYKCFICGSNKKLNAHHIDPVWNNLSISKDLSNLVCLCGRCHSNIHSKNLEIKFMEHFLRGEDVSIFSNTDLEKKERDKNKKIGKSTKLITKFTRIKSIKYIGKEKVYDLSVSGPFHNFIANGMVVHNSVNELSGRYSEMPEEFYIPEIKNVRKQSSINHQGSEGFLDDNQSNKFLNDLREGCSKSFEYYHDFLNNGIVREQSRVILPLNTYTEWYWKIDLKNLLHFLELRCAPNAQQEIRVYANAILDLIYPIIPWVIDAWEDYNSYRNGVLLTKYEVDSLKKYLSEVENLKKITKNTELKIGPIEVENDLEKNEWVQKLNKLIQ